MDNIIDLSTYFDSLSLDSIKTNEFEKMRDIYGERKLEAYFDKILKGNDLFSIKKVNKIVDSYISSFAVDIDNNLLDNAFLSYNNSLNDFSVLSLEENNIYGKLLLDNRDVFNISSKDDNNIFKDKNIRKIGKKMLDMVKIFVSVRDEKDKKEILDLFDKYYSSETWNENKTDEIIKKYISDYKTLCDVIDGVPNIKQLNVYFMDKPYNVFDHFDIDKRTEDVDGLKNNLKKYFTYMYARNIMVVHNLKLVTSIAYSYSSVNYDIMDIVNDGILGLYRAVDKYNYTKGSKLSSFAYISIKRSIMREWDNTGRLIRMPVHSNDIWRKINYYRNNYINIYAKEPSAEVIASELNLSIDFVRELLKCENNYFAPFSLNNITSNDEKVEYIDCVISRDLPVDEQAMRNVVSSMIYGVIDELNDRDKDIVMKRFGFDGKGGKSLREIGVEYGVSRQNINQIEQRILKRMLERKEIRKLRGFYN